MGPFLSFSGRSYTLFGFSAVLMKGKHFAEALVLYWLSKHGMNALALITQALISHRVQKGWITTNGHFCGYQHP
jgi:hypothetical protein